jgi:hypothetical protein
MLLTNEVNSGPAVAPTTSTVEPVAPRRIVRPSLPATSMPRQP